MYITDLTEKQLAMLKHYVDIASERHEKFKLGFDESDMSLKFKIGEYSWSPPMATEQR
jgi:hypothetical protein